MSGYSGLIGDLESGWVPSLANRADVAAIAGLLRPTDESEEQALLSAADRVRRTWVGDGIHLRGLIEFSNICARGCTYCGIRAGQADVRRYRLTEEELIGTAREAVALGYKTLVLQSGEDAWFDAPTIARIVCRTKALGEGGDGGLAVTLSVGERPKADYRMWREAGADRYLLRFETSDPGMYARLHPGMSYEERFRCLRDLQDLGYQVGSGFLVGLPGQTDEMIVGDLLTLRELGVEMAGIGPFLPAPGTPLADASPPEAKLCYRVVALARLIVPWAHIPATTAIGTIEAMGRLKALEAGANVVMPNVTPQPYRSMYQLYPNKICLNDTASHCRGCIEGQIRSIGRHVAAGAGHGQLGSHPMKGSATI